jgi:hypothetical protein
VVPAAAAHRGHAHAAPAPPLLRLPAAAKQQLPAGLGPADPRGVCRWAEQVQAGCWRAGSAAHRQLCGWAAGAAPRGAAACLPTARGRRPRDHTRPHGRPPFASAAPPGRPRGASRAAAARPRRQTGCWRPPPARAGPHARARSGGAQARRRPGAGPLARTSAMGAWQRRCRRRQVRRAGAGATAGGGPGRRGGSTSRHSSQRLEQMRGGSVLRSTRQFSSSSSGGGSSGSNKPSSGSHSRVLEGNRAQRGPRWPLQRPQRRSRPRKRGARRRGAAARRQWSAPRSGSGSGTRRARPLSRRSRGQRRRRRRRRRWPQRALSGTASWRTAAWSRQQTAWTRQRRRRGALQRRGTGFSYLMTDKMGEATQPAKQHSLPRGLLKHCWTTERSECPLLHAPNPSLSGPTPSQVFGDSPIELWDWAESQPSAGPGTGGGGGDSASGAVGGGGKEFEDDAGGGRREEQEAWQEGELRLCSVGIARGAARCRSGGLAWGATGLMRWVLDRTTCPPALTPDALPPIHSLLDGRRCRRARRRSRRSGRRGRARARHAGLSGAAAAAGAAAPRARAAGARGTRAGGVEGPGGPHGAAVQGVLF